MTVSVVFAIAGVIALLFGIIGGGIKAKEIEVPLLPIRARVVTIIVGLTLLGITIWLESKDSLIGASGGPQSTSMPPLSPSQAGNLPASDSPATSTPVPAPTVTQAGAELDRLYSKLYEAKTWNLVLKDTFDENTAHWTLWNVDDETKNETMEINGGALVWGLRIKTPDQFFYEIAPVYSYDDFYYSAKIKRKEGPSTENQAAWGILFRREGRNYYTFRLNDVQEYSIQIHDQDGWTDLIGWTKSPFVEANESNELTVIAEGADLYFFINGTPIRIINDTTYSSGNVGFLAGLNYVGEEMTYFEFDDFELREKP